MNNTAVLVVQVNASLVDDAAFLVLADTLALHVIDGSIHAVHRGWRGFTMTVNTDGLYAVGAQNLL